MKPKKQAGNALAFGIIFFLAGTPIQPAAAQTEAPPWKAAVAKAKITPRELGWMAGYAARKGPAEKVIQDLWAKTLVAEDASGTRVAIVTLDLIGVPRPLRDEVEAFAEKTHGIAPGCLLINASHTHSGPAIRLYRPRGGKGPPRVGYRNIPDAEQDLRVRQVEQYNEFLRNQIRKAIGEAVDNLGPASLQWSRAKCGFAMNRRTPVISSSGAMSFRNSPNPDGLVDHEVPVLQVRDSEDKLRGLLFGYACHATTMGTLEMHGDWPGYAQQYVEEDHPGITALFLNGCSGDQNPYPRRLPVFMHRHGRSMAMAVEAALQTRQKPLSGPLRGAIAWPEIGYSDIPNAAQLKEKIAQTSGAEQASARFLLEELEAAGDLPASYPVPVQVIRFGDSLSIVAIGGETTVEYSLRIKRELSEKTKGAVWVAGYCNDVMTYIPSRKVLEEGGYEGRTSMFYVRSSVHPSPWVPEIEEILVGKALQLFGEN